MYCTVHNGCPSPGLIKFRTLGRSLCTYSTVCTPMICASAARTMWSTCLERTWCLWRACTAPTGPSPTHPGRYPQSGPPASINHGQVGIINIKIILHVFKGSVSQDFRPPIFHVSNPSGPLMNRLNYFRIRFRFRRDIRSQRSKIDCTVCTVHHTAESKF